MSSRQPSNDGGVACIATLDADGRLQFAAGADPHPRLASIEGLITADDVAELRSAAGSRNGWRRCFSIPGADRLWIEAHFAVQPAVGGALRLEGFISDVTVEANRAERLDRLNRLFRTLSEVNKLIPRELPKPDYVDVICRIAADTDGFVLAWVGLIDADRVLRTAACAGRSRAYIEDLILSGNPAVPEGLGPTGIAQRTARRVVTNDFLGSPLTEYWHERAAEFGIASSVALPITVGGKIVGVFSVYGDACGQFDDAALALLDDMAVDVGFGLQAIEHAARLEAASRELRASLQRLAEIESATKAGSFHWSPPDGELWWSAGAAAVLGLSAVTVPSREVLLAATLPEVEPVLMSAFAEAREAGAHVDIEIPVGVRTGGRRWVRLFGVAVEDAFGALRIVGTLQDVTNRKRLEAELLMTVDRERQRLAAEIHDDLGQILTGATLMAAAAVKDAESAAPTLCEPIAKIADALALATAACRQIAHDAAPPLAGPLLPALRNLAAMNSSHSVRCVFEYGATLEPELTGAQAVDLYRITQEALTNALKHSRCSLVKIVLTGRSGFFELVITDNGVGLGSHRPTAAGGLGMRTMKYRAVRAGGTFAVTAAAGGGTSVRVLIPQSSPAELARAGSF